MDIKNYIKLILLLSITMNAHAQSTKKTLIRTVEWLAKHKVSYKVPKNFPGEIVSTRTETDNPAKNP